MLYDICLPLMVFRLLSSKPSSWLRMDDLFPILSRSLHIVTVSFFYAICRYTCSYIYSLPLCSKPDHTTSETDLLEHDRFERFTIDMTFSGCTPSYRSIALVALITGLSQALLVSGFAPSRPVVTSRNVNGE